MQETRKHIDTILIERAGRPEPDAVFVSSFGGKTGLGLSGGGDAEVWLDREECRAVLASMDAAAVRVETKDYEAFAEFYLEQPDDLGILVPGFVLITNHGREIGLFISVKGGDGGQVWMTPSHSSRVMAALRAAGP